MRRSNYSVSLATFGFAFAIALSPALVQTSQLSCAPGDATLSDLQIEVNEQDQITFSAGQSRYAFSTSAATATLRATATKADARVSYQWWAGGYLIGEGELGVGGGEETVSLPRGQTLLRINVAAGPGALGHYTVDVDRSFVAEAPVTVSGTSPFSTCTADAGGGVFAPDSEVEPWISVNQLDPLHLVAAWQQDRYLSGGGARGHVGAVSFDGGVNWTPVTIPGLSLCSGGAWDRVTDPWLTFAANGDLYAAAVVWTYVDTGGAIVVSRSTDGGLNWDAPVIVDETTEPQYNDRETMIADRNDPCTVYLTWTRLDSEAPSPGDVLFSKTTDCGATWTTAVVVQHWDPAAAAAQTVPLPNGELLAFFREGQNGGVRPIFVERSTDGGLSWPDDPIVVADAVRPRVFSPDGALVRSSMFDVGVNHDTGDVYVVWERVFDAALQVALSTSSDGGLTWTAPIRIDDTPPNATFTLEQAFAPTVEVLDDGTIGVTYYSFQNDTAGATPSWADHWFVSCHPEVVDCRDPASWSAALRLTPSSFDYSLAASTSGFDSGLFLGDYFGLTAAGNDFFAFFSVTTATDPGNGTFVRIRGE